MFTNRGVEQALRDISAQLGELRASWRDVNGLVAQLDLQLETMRKLEHRLRMRDVRAGRTNGDLEGSEDQAELDRALARRRGF